MGVEHLVSSPIASVLARGSVRGIVLLVIGGILLIVGALRLLRFRFRFWQPSD